MADWRTWGYIAGQWLGQWNPVDLIALLLVACIWLWLWRKAKDKKDTFDPSDFLKDPFTSKVSSAALSYMVMLGLSVWFVIREEADGRDPSATMLTVMGIFVAKAGADRAMSAWGARRPPDAPTPPGEPVPVESPDISIKVDAPAEISTVTKVTKGAA